MLMMGRSTWPSGTWGAVAGPAAPAAPAAVRAAAPTCSPLAAPRSWTQGIGGQTDVAAGAWACCAGPAFQRDSHRCRRASSRRATCAHTLTPTWLRGNCTVMGLLCLVRGVAVGCGHNEEPWPGGSHHYWDVGFPFNSACQMSNGSSGQAFGGLIVTLHLSAPHWSDGLTSECCGPV